MIRRAAAALLAVVAAVGLLGPAALADDEVKRCTGMEDWAEPPTCVQNQQGDWVAVGGQQDADEDVGRFIVYEQPSSSVPPLMVLSIALWTIVPIFLAVRMARNRSEPATSGVVLTLLLGWIGLLIAVLMQPRSERKLG